MKLFKKLIPFTLLAQFAIAQEDPLYRNNPQKKDYYFGSVSIAPGIGLSKRTWEESSGTSWDYKIGIIPAGSHSIPVPSVDYNLYHLPWENQVYVSYGIGTAYVVPYIPLRIGKEFNHGFFDFGVKMMMGIIPSPEFRFGYQFDY